MLPAPITCTKKVRALVPASRALIAPTPSPVPATVMVLLDLARMPPLSRRRSRKLLMTNAPPVSKVSELMVVVERALAAAPELTPALTTRVLVFVVTAAFAAVTLISLVALSGRTPLVAPSFTRNCVVAVVPELVAEVSATAQGKICLLVAAFAPFWPTSVIQLVGAVVVARMIFVFEAPAAWPRASPRRKRVAKLLEVRVPAPEVVIRRLALLLSRVMTLWEVVTARYWSVVSASVTAVEPPRSSRCPPKRSTRREPRRTLLAVPVLSSVSRVPGSRVSAAALPFRVMVPASPSLPAPLTITRPRLMVVESKVLAAVRVSVLLPTLVRV